MWFDKRGCSDGIIDRNQGEKTWDPVLDFRRLVVKATPVAVPHPPDDHHRHLQAEEVRIKDTDNQVLCLQGLWAFVEVISSVDACGN